ncbi:hypothetical protein [Pseudoponticoccus marisrubri]|uniref:Uncharacterized protein n=1 Tax=Pseudoponticoccus marisrubri TaxID=1685382 RepID=A0A0W7WGG1_9RHOB|nr:hypothetical protein [Pseudoponticoccus marisrubri]KUF09654.1 hypothetical protein AVJ23_15975 [Pseudoponticoccus marisrubri]
MSQFTALISLYYLCDQAAATRGLDADEVTRCMANYERLKMHFVEKPHARQGSPARAAQIREGYAGFKAWEAANSTLVADLRARARAHLGRD